MGCGLCRHAGRGGCCCRSHRGEDGGHLLRLRVGGGCVPAVWGTDLVGSGMWGRCGAAVTTEWVGLGWAPEICEDVRLSAHEGEQFVWGAFVSRGGRA